MPIFEYICKKCGHGFEVIIQGQTKTECPLCKGRKLEKQLSVFAASIKGNGMDSRDLPVGPCGTCGDPRGPGSCSMN